MTTSNETTSQPPEHQDHPLFGMVCAIAAYFMFAVMNVFAKLLSEHHHVVEIGFYRNLIATIPFLVMIYIMGRRDILKINSSPKAVVIRSVVGTVSLITTFAAYSMMPLADATAFLFASSLIVPAFGFFFLKEYVGPYRWGAIVVGFIGVLIMLNPGGSSTVSLLGVALAMSAALMHATLQTILRALGKTESPETVTFYFVFVGTFISLIPMPLFFKMPALSEIPYILALGITGVIAQLLLSRAYKNAPASVVTVFNYSGIIWATLFGWMIWNDWPAQHILVGGSIIIASNIFIIYREQKLARIARAEVQKTPGI